MRKCTLGKCLWRIFQLGECDLVGKVLFGKVLVENVPVGKVGIGNSACWESAS